jgi:hypothetical protein
MRDRKRWVPVVGLHGGLGSNGGHAAQLPRQINV